MTKVSVPLVILAVLAVTASAFAPSDSQSHGSRSKQWSTSASYAPMKRVGFSGPPSSTYRRNVGSAHRMSSDPEAEAAKLRAQAQKLREEAAEAAGVTVEEMTTAAQSGGTVYDDEVPVERDTLSPAMRERLMREAGTGLDSNEAQPNVILFISIGVAILVILGGSGILY